MGLNSKAKYKSKSIIYHCRYILRIYAPYCKYAAYGRYTMFARAIVNKKGDLYTKTDYGNIYQKNRRWKLHRHPLDLYRISSINNIFEKANPIVADDSVH